MPKLHVQIRWVWTERFGDILMAEIPNGAFGDERCQIAYLSRESAQDLFGLLGKVLQEEGPPLHKQESLFG